LTITGSFSVVIYAERDRVLWTSEREQPRVWAIERIV